METPPRTPESSPRIPSTPPPILRNVHPVINTPDTIIEEQVVDPRMLFDDADFVDDDDILFEDLHFLPPPIPLVRQNAVEGINLGPPVGIAYEIHNYANNILPEKVIPTLENVMRKSRYVYTPATHLNEMIRLRISQNFVSAIHGNNRYSQEEKERKISQFDQIFYTRIVPFDFTQDPVETQMIGLSVDYALSFNKSDLLRQLYIDTFLTDCVYAYPTAPNAEPYSGMSCIHGVIERLYISLPEAIRQRLKERNVKNYRLSAKQEGQYKEVLESFESHNRIIDEINAAVMEWFDTLDHETVPESFTKRKQLLTEHIVRHMNAKGYSYFREDSPELLSYYSTNTWLATSLSRNPPVMGGKKSLRTRKSKRTHTREDKIKRSTRRTKEERGKTQRKKDRRTFARKDKRETLKVYK